MAEGPGKTASEGAHARCWWALPSAGEGVEPGGTGGGVERHPQDAQGSKTPITASRRAGVPAPQAWPTCTHLGQGRGILYLVGPKGPGCP